MNTTNLVRIPGIVVLFIAIMFVPVLAEQSWQNDIKIDSAEDNAIHIHVTNQEMSTQQEMLAQQGVLAHNHTTLEVNTSQPVPSLELVLYIDKADGYNLEVVTENFTFTPESTNQANVNGQGHAHLYINGKKIQRLYSPWVHLGSKLFSEGSNTIMVTLNANDHSAWAIDDEMIKEQVVLDHHLHLLPENSNLEQQFTYLLDWELENVEFNEDGQGWATTNNLDYQIQVERGYLVNRSVELIACEHDHADGMSSVISNLFLPQPASAGHGNTDHDASRISSPFVESLTTPGTIELETVTGIEPAYCQSHYLIAPGIETARNMPDDRDMLDTSLFIEGTYQAPGSNTEIPFTINTDLAWGTVTDFATGEANFSLENQTNTVTIRRNLSTLFDDVDFNEMPNEEQAKAVLRSLVMSASISIQ